jgi:site-specific DNA recombinase
MYLELVRQAAIYCRISDDREGAGLGVARQEADCRERAKRLGWTVAGLYVDNDFSAYSGKIRPEYRRLLADLRAGVLDAVIAWHTDRLHRSPRAGGVHRRL